MAIFRGAGGSGDATTDATNQASVASDAAAAASASQIAAATSAANAATSATNASNSATAAANSASSASSSASTATTQASLASTSASNASTSETNAASSASSATSSASTATTQATNASTSATAAAASAASASTNVDNAFNAITATATTLSPGASATASFNTSTKLLTLGVPSGATGTTGATGATGAGVIVGGTTNQVLAKASNTNYDTTWKAVTGTGNVVLSASPTLTGAVNVDGGASTVTLDSNTAVLIQYDGGGDTSIGSPGFGKTTYLSDDYINISSIPTNKILGTSSSSSDIVAKDVTGTGSVVLGTAPTITLVNGTGLPIGGITATGTPSSTTYLRGDGTWSTVSGSGTVTSVAALTLGTTGTDLSSTVATGTTTPVITLNVPTASATNRGVLSSTDWTTFNNKGSGTITSITAGTGLSGGTITSSGTIAIDSTVATLTGSQVLTNKTISGSTNTLSDIGNSSLTNSAITINGTSTSLGGSISVGTVTSVTGTSPVVSSGGATPAISMPAATTSVSGYLTSTDWNTFNNKGSGTVTSVSVVSANGFTGTSSGGATPALTLTTSITGLLKGNGTAISAATSGTDYAPATSGTSILYGNGSGGFSNVTVGSGLSFSAGTLSASGGGGMTYPSGTGIAVVSGGTSWGTTLTAPSGAIVGTSDTQTLTNKTLTDPLLIGTITEDVFTITDAAGFAIDPTNGSIQLVTLGASRTPTVANFDAGEAITLMINDGTAYTITWSTIGVVWVGGTAPTLATTGYTVIELWRVGSTYYGALVGSVA